MITKWDDYWIHQIAEPIEHVSATEELWIESICYTMGSVDKRFFLTTGMVSVPNTGVMAGYALAHRDGVQYNFRASRELQNDRANTVVGPLYYTIVDPMTKWSLRLEENKHAPISFDLEFDAMSEPELLKPTPERTAQSGERYCMLGQSLSVSGRITIAGNDYDPAGCHAGRSRYWGVRGMWLDIGFFMAIKR